jgi:hypothetical protein
MYESIHDLLVAWRPVVPAGCFVGPVHLPETLAEHVVVPIGVMSDVIKSTKNIVNFTYHHLSGFPATALLNSTLANFQAV